MSKATLLKYLLQEKWEKQHFELTEMKILISKYAWSLASGVIIVSLTRSFISLHIKHFLCEA